MKIFEENRIQFTHSYEKDYSVIDKGNGDNCFATRLANLFQELISFRKRLSFLTLFNIPGQGDNLL
jgi:hypothetical protein